MTHRSTTKTWYSALEQGEYDGWPTGKAMRNWRWRLRWRRLCRLFRRTR
jgi:hypothetical protein